jgi:hypothetical protein
MVGMQSENYPGVSGLGASNSATRLLEAKSGGTRFLKDPLARLRNLLDAVCQPAKPVQAKKIEHATDFTAKAA